MTPDLIFGLMFALFAVIIVVAIMTLYVGGKTQDDAYIVGVILLFVFILLSAVFFADHVTKVNEKELLERQEMMKELDVFQDE